MPTCRRRSRYRPGSTLTSPPGAATSATRSSRCSPTTSPTRYHPYDEPLLGAEAVAGSWLENQDEPGTWEAEYAPVLIAGDEVIATGETRYTDGEVFSNLWQLEFAPDGRCSRFVEWYLPRPRRLDAPHAQPHRALVPPDPLPHRESERRTSARPRTSSSRAISPAAACSGRRDRPRAPRPRRGRARFESTTADDASLRGSAAAGGRRGWKRSTAVRRTLADEEHVRDRSECPVVVRSGRDP